jgi:hypothetical protein
MGIEDTGRSSCALGEAGAEVRGVSIVEVKEDADERDMVRRSGRKGAKVRVSPVVYREYMASGRKMENRRRVDWYRQTWQTRLKM